MICCQDRLADDFSGCRAFPRLTNSCESDKKFNRKNIRQVLLGLDVKSSTIHEDLLKLLYWPIFDDLKTLGKRLLLPIEFYFGKSVKSLPYELK